MQSMDSDFEDPSVSFLICKTHRRNKRRYQCKCFCASQRVEETGEAFAQYLIYKILIPRFL